MMELEKKQLRKQYIRIRSAIENRLDKSKIITKKIVAEQDYQSAQVIALYKNLKSEVDTEELIQNALNSGKTVVLPKVIKDRMQFYKINSIKDKWVKSDFGVEEPVENEENLIRPEQIDLMIVPGVCFDKKNNRLGFGKGYYDKFLTEDQIKTIGICFREQIVDALPITPNDVKMDKVITD